MKNNIYKLKDYFFCILFSYFEKQKKYFRENEQIKSCSTEKCRCPNTIIKIYTSEEEVYA